MSSDKEYVSDVILAEFFEKGIGTECDPERARRILEDCQYVAEAYYQCGRMCRDGVGGPVDTTTAIDKFKAASEESHAQASYELALILLRKDIPSHNINDAIQYLGLAMEGGVGLAAKQLGLLYLNGSGVARNFAMAKEYFDKATELGIDGLDDLLAENVLSASPSASSPLNVLKRRYVVVDFETTGFASSAHRVIEIGAVEIKDGALGKTFQTLVNPRMQIPPRATEVHHITNAMLVTAPSSEEAFRQLLHFIGDDVLVAHNIQFELAFLRSECARFNHQPNHETLCTLKFSKRLYPNFESYKLGELINQFNIKAEGPLHRALPDAVCTAKLLIAMKKEDLANQIP